MALGCEPPRVALGHCNARACPSRLSELSGAVARGLGAKLLNCCEPRQVALVFCSARACPSRLSELSGAVARGPVPRFSFRPRRGEGQALALRLKKRGPVRDRPSPYGFVQTAAWRGTGPRPTVRKEKQSGAGQALALRCMEKKIIKKRKDKNWPKKQSSYSVVASIPPLHSPLRCPKATIPTR